MCEPRKNTLQNMNILIYGPHRRDPGHPLLLGGATLPTIQQQKSSSCRVGMGMARLPEVRETLVIFSFPAFLVAFFAPFRCLGPRSS